MIAWPRRSVPPPHRMGAMQSGHASIQEEHNSKVSSACFPRIRYPDTYIQSPLCRRLVSIMHVNVARKPLPILVVFRKRAATDSRNIDENGIINAVCLLQFPASISLLIRFRGYHCTPRKEGRPPAWPGRLPAPSKSRPTA